MLKSCRICQQLATPQFHLSDYIKALQTTLAEHGDVPLFWSDGGRTECVEDLNELAAFAAASEAREVVVITCGHEVELPKRFVL